MTQGLVDSLWSPSFGSIFLHYSAPAQTAREGDRPRAQLEEPQTANTAVRATCLLKPVPSGTRRAWKTTLCAGQRSRFIAKN